jgi:uncharacterized protein (DUF58 family)
MSESLLSPSFLTLLDRLTLVTRRARVGAFKGERRSPRHGGSVEFADFREYAPGDDFRQIDWNAYARLERLFLRLFIEEEDATIHIIVDASASMNWGEPAKWQYAQRVAAALGYVALIGMDRLVGAAVGGRPQGFAPTLFPPHRGKHQAQAWFDWLTKLQPSGEASPAKALAQYAAQTRRVGLLVVISDLMDSEWREGIGLLAQRRYEISALHLLSPEELNPTLEGDLKLLDSETNHAVEITADFDLLSRYRARAQIWRDEWQQFCAARAIHYASLETSLPFEELVLSFLRRRGILK